MRYLLSLASLLLATSGAFAAKLAFIVNAESDITELSVSQITDYYFKRTRTWPNGTKIRFIDHGDKELRNQFCKSVLRKTPRDVDLFWIGEKNFSGQGAPIEARDDEMVISSVASLPGAIGYISDASEEDLTGVRKVTIKGIE